MGVFLACASPRGRAFLDRELYLPAEWMRDTARRQEAHVPATVRFATKPGQRRLGGARLPPGVVALATPPPSAGHALSLAQAAPPALSRLAAARRLKVRLEY